MASFFGDLTSLRSTGFLSPERTKAARDHCKGGTLVRNLNDLRAWMEERFPPSPIFNAGMSSGSFPQNLAAFIVSVDGVWDRIDQHGVYVALGELVQERLRDAKLSMTREAYRDHMAGAKQHYANGMVHAAQEAARVKRAEVHFPGWPQSMSVAQMARAGVDAQQQAASLRSEKYAAPGSSSTAFLSYKASLENLAGAYRVLASLLHENQNAAEISSLHELALQMQHQAENLALASAPLVRAIESGRELSVKETSAIERDRMASAVRRPGSSVEGRRCEICAQCKAQASSCQGIICMCISLCQDCTIEGTIMECPLCGTFGEFLNV